jgi:hypothetical protein
MNKTQSHRKPEYTVDSQNETLYCRAFRLLSEIRGDDAKLRVAVKMLGKIALLHGESSDEKG